MVKPYLGTPPTQVDSNANRLSAPIASADDDQASLVSKILQAQQNPHASEATSVTNLARELNQQAALLEADETLSPAGRRERLIPEVDRVRGRLEKVRAT